MLSQVEDMGVPGLFCGSGDFMDKTKKHIHLVNIAAADKPKLAEDPEPCEGCEVSDVCTAIDFGFGGGCEQVDECGIDYT